MRFKKMIACLMCAVLLFGSSAGLVLANGSNSILHKIYRLAGEGMTLKSKPFSIGSKMEDIVQIWGEPNTEYFGISLMYSGVAFFNEEVDPFGMEGHVTTIMDGSSELEGITYDALVKELGEPIFKETRGKYHMALGYKINGNYLYFELELGEKDSSHTVSHYRVSNKKNQNI